MLTETSLIEASDSSMEEPQAKYFYQVPEYVLEVDPNTKIISVYLNGPISSTIHRYMELISVLNNASASFEIHFFINSPGGVLNTTYAILSALQNTPAKVITHNTALAASCGSLLLSMGDKIAIHPYAITMFHNASTMTMGDINASKIKLELTIKEIEFLVSKFMERGIITEAEVKEIITSQGEFYFTDEEMISRLEKADLLYKGV